MKSVKHKQELSKFCHLSVFNVNPTGDSVHVKMIINITPNTGQQMHVK